jgi:hypothetical protein
MSTRIVHGCVDVRENDLLAAEGVDFLLSGLELVEQWTVRGNRTTGVSSSGPRPEDAGALRVEEQ